MNTFNFTNDEIEAMIYEVAMMPRDEVPSIQTPRGMLRIYEILAWIRVTPVVNVYD